MDLSAAVGPASVTFSQSTIRNGTSQAAIACYSVDGGQTQTLDGVTDYVGTDYGEAITPRSGLGNVFQLSTVVGGTGYDTITLTRRGGYANYAGVTGIENYVNGSSRLMTLPDSVFTNVEAGTISLTLFAGSIANPPSLDASAIQAGHTLQHLASAFFLHTDHDRRRNYEHHGKNVFAGGGETLQGGMRLDSIYVTQQESLGFYS